MSHYSTVVVVIVVVVDVAVVVVVTVVMVLISLRKRHTGSLEGFTQYHTGLDDSFNG